MKNYFKVQFFMELVASRTAEQVADYCTDPVF